MVKPYTHLKNLRTSFSKYKVRLSQKISYAILGRLSGNVPGTIINSIEEHSYDPIIKEHVEEVISIAAPTIRKYSFPGSFPASFRRNKAFDKKNLYLLKNVYVSPFSGLSWIDNNYFLVESLGSMFRMIGWDNLLHEPLLGREKLNENDFVISCPNHPFYHWLFESLPGILIALETMPSAKVMITSKCPSHSREILKILFGEHAYKERVIVANSIKLVPRFFTLQQEPDAGFVHPIAIQYLHQFRDKILAQADNLTTPSHIYVSRKKARKRKLANEAEVEQAMQQIGFDIVYCEDLSIIQQIAIFSQATCIVAPHGAGLSNLVWAKQKVNVLEIFSYGYFNDCFARLAVSLGLEYHYTYAEPCAGSNGKIQVQEVIEMTLGILKRENVTVPEFAEVAVTPALL